MFGTTSETLGTTPFVFIATAKRYGTIPIHFEEFTHKQLSEKEDLIKRLATERRAIMMRGTQSQRVNEYPIQYPVVITGEDNIYSRGILTRSIVLNVSLNARHHNDEAYYKWTEFCSDSRLLSWLNMFLEDYWREYREYISNVPITNRNRDSVKRQVLSNTLDFLIDKELLDQRLINKTALFSIFDSSDRYTSAISTNTYNDMLTGVTSYIDFGDLESENYDNNITIKQLCDNTFFNIENNYIVIATYKYLQLYKQLNGDRYMRSNEYDANIMQSPDFLFREDTKIVSISFEDNGTINKTRKRKLIGLRVSDMNKEIFYNILCHKLHKFHGMSDEFLVMDLADNLLNKMSAIKDVPNDIFDRDRGVLL